VSQIANLARFGCREAVVAVCDHRSEVFHGPWLEHRTKRELWLNCAFISTSGPPRVDASDSICMPEILRMGLLERARPPPRNCSWLISHRACHDHGVEGAPASTSADEMCSARKGASVREKSKVMWWVSKYVINPPMTAWHRPSAEQKFEEMSM